ncbi:hypothetical protein [Streptomyces capoamus]|uniref:hypothetical protein n=1 Tax=Streptomyces capoamus TaxID=68183 RepID=UPI0033998C25
MAMMCYSDLEDDDPPGVAALDALHASLERWVVDLLAETAYRATRPPARFVWQVEDRTPAAASRALETIRFIRYAAEQLLDRNAFLRYLCPDCPREGHARCPALGRPRRAGKAVHEAVYAVPVAPLPVQRGTWPVRSRPVTSRVVGRLRLMARRLREAACGAEACGAEEGAARTTLVAHLYDMARAWTFQGLDDSVVNVDEEHEGKFVREVMRAVMRKRDDALDGADARHSPVNFIAAILRTLVEQVGGPRTFTVREAVVAALVARNAAIEGDAVAVDDFSRTWLGLGRPGPWRAAVEMALLGDWVDALGRHVSDDAEIMELLHLHTHREHRRLQPLWERQVRGRTVRLLDEPVGPGLSLRELVAQRGRPEDRLLLGEVEDPRVQAVLARLAPPEKAVAMAYAAQRVTWTEAAVEGGAADPGAFGERVRRKLKRLGRLHGSTATDPSASLPAVDR